MATRPLAGSVSKRSLAFWQDASPGGFFLAAPGQVVGMTGALEKQDRVWKTSAKLKE